MALLDSESVERLQRLPPRQAYMDLKQIVFRGGAISSEDFQTAFEQLVDAGILSWDQIEDFERH